jgi:hypothetical protein
VPGPDHVTVIICDARRAEQWRRGFAREGIAAIVAETRGADSEKGACAVAVPATRRLEASALVAAVARGERALPGPGLGARGVIAILLVAALVAAFAANRL